MLLQPAFKGFAALMNRLIKVSSFHWVHFSRGYMLRTGVVKSFGHLILILAVSLIPCAGEDAG